MDRNLHHFRHSLSRRGYSLIEILIAGAILAMGLAAATSLALTMLTQEEINARVARGINIGEQAATLWQLGLDEATITLTIPTNTNIQSLTITPTTTNIAGIGEVEIATIETVIRTTPDVTWSEGFWTAGGQTGGIERTNSILAVRPVTR